MSLEEERLPQAVGSFLPPRDALKARGVSRAFRANTAQWIQCLAFSDLRGVTEEQAERLAADLSGLKTFEVDGTTDEPEWSTQEAAERSGRIAAAFLRGRANTLQNIHLAAPFATATRGLQGVVFRKADIVLIDLYSLMAVVRGGTTFPQCTALVVFLPSGEQFFSSAEELIAAVGFNAATEEARSSLEAALLQHFPQLEHYRTQSGVWIVPEGGANSTLQKVVLDAQQFSTQTEGILPRVNAMPQSVKDLVLWFDDPDTDLDFQPIRTVLNSRPRLTLRLVVPGMRTGPELANMLDTYGERLRIAVLTNDVGVESDAQPDHAWHHAAKFLRHVEEHGNTAGITQWRDLLDSLGNVSLSVSGSGAVVGPLVGEDGVPADVTAGHVSYLLVSIDASDPERPAKHMTLTSPLPPNLHLPNLNGIQAQIKSGIAHLGFTMHLGDGHDGPQGPVSTAGSLLAGISKGRSIEKFTLDSLGARGRPESLRDCLACNRDLAGAVTNINLCLSGPPAKIKQTLQALFLASSLMTGVTQLEIRPWRSGLSRQQKTQIGTALARLVEAMGASASCLQEVRVNRGVFADSGEDMRSAVETVVREAVEKAGLGDRVVVVCPQESESSQESEMDSDSEGSD